jgi:hypothetical protein
MLPDHLLQLLTAYVDGELSTRQRKAVLRLLHRSAEARRLYQQLRDDAARLRGLPRARLGRHFAQRVLRNLSDGRLQLDRRSGVAERPAIPSWVGLAVAAAVLLIVSVSSYLYFAAVPPEGNPDGAADLKKPAPAEPGPERQPGPEKEPPVPPRAKHEQKPSGRPGLFLWALDQAGRWGAEQFARRPSPGGPKEKRESDPLVSPPKGVFDIDFVRGPKLLLLKVRELDQEKPRQQLRDGLNQESAHRLVLFCLETAKALPRLQTALQAHGVRLLIDKEAQTCLTKRLKTNYVLYAEDLTAEELATILQEIGRDDKKAEAQRDGQFDRLMVNPLGPDDYKELSSLLGVDAKVLQPSKPGIDPRKPVSDGTADNVIRVLEGQGPPRPDPSKPPVSKAPERLALVLPSNVARPRSPSKEVKQFLDSRKERRPGTVQMLLVLRQSKG